MKTTIRGSNIKTFEFEKEKIWLLTETNGTKKSVKNWTTDGDDTSVYFKMNASFFNGNVVQGRNVGYKPNLEYVQGRPDQEANLTRYDLVIYDDMTYAYGQFMSWDRVQTNITCGYSVPLIVIEKGNDVNLYSTYLKKNANSINVVTTYTGLIRTKNGKWVAFNAKNNSPSSLRTYFKTIYDVEFMCINDGGGSTQTVHYENGKMIVTDYDNEDRAVPNIIAGVIDNRNQEPVEPTKQKYNKRKFGMRTLNITQGRFEPNGLSHKYLNAYDVSGEDGGIDKFVAFYNYEVIAIWEYSKTKFANTIMFYDKGNDITLALTHMNTIDPNKWYVGKVFTVGEEMYYEGTKGNATGNHIHLEVAKGKQTSKVNKGDNNGGWQLNNLINIEDYFYLEKDFHVVLNDHGYDFEWREVEKPTPEEPKEETISLEEYNKLKAEYDKLSEDYIALDDSFKELTDKYNKLELVEEDLQCAIKELEFEVETLNKVDEDVLSLLKESSKLVEIAVAELEKKEIIE